MLYTAAYNYSGYEVVGMRFLIAADIVYQPLSSELARRAGCEQTEPRAQSEELRRVPRE